jgi:hypothetical protein
MSYVPSNGFTTFINDPDQSPYLVTRAYAQGNKNWTEKQDKVGKSTVLALLNRGLDVTTMGARMHIASRVNMEAELRNLAAIAAGNNPAVGDDFKRDDHGVKHKLAKWLQELYKKGRITEAAKDTAIAGLQLQCIQLQGQLTTANNLKEELQGQVATLEEQLTTVQGQLTTVNGQKAHEKAQLQGQLTTANNLKEELQRKVSTLEEQLKTAQAKNDELPPKKRKRENKNTVDLA